MESIIRYHTIQQEQLQDVKNLGKKHKEMEECHSSCKAIHEERATALLQADASDDMTYRDWGHR